MFCMEENVILCDFIYSVFSSVLILFIYLLNLIFILDDSQYCIILYYIKYVLISIN